jgi:Acyl-CoA reductase (LuxC)
VTLSNLLENRIELVFGDLDLVAAQKPLNVFDETVVEFLGDLSSFLSSDDRCRGFPDLISFAFFVRRQNLRRLSSLYQNEKLRVGRGVTLHFTPANVPINFAYSVAFALISGNPSLVRLSSTNFEQIELFVNAWEKICDLKKFERFRSFLCMIRYPHNREITQLLSQFSNVRIIWGGDNSVSEIRSISSKLNCLDVVFPNRYAISVFDSFEVLKLSKGELAKLANDFYRDNFTFDQNACSSSKMVYWFGEPQISERAKLLFWECLDEIVSSRYDNQEKFGTSKLLYLSKMAALSLDNQLQWTKYPSGFDVVSITLGISSALLEDTRYGLFFEKNIYSKIELFASIDPKIQTINFFGESFLKSPAIIKDLAFLGVDRLVKIGQALEMGVVWDGYDLPIILSRCIDTPSNEVNGSFL